MIAVWDCSACGTRRGDPHRGLCNGKRWDNPHLSLDEERIVYAPRLFWLNDIWHRALNAYLLNAPLIVALAWRISCL